MKRDVRDKQQLATVFSIVRDSTMPARLEKKDRY